MKEVFAFYTYGYIIFVKRVISEGVVHDFEQDTT